MIALAAPVVSYIVVAIIIHVVDDDDSLALLVNVLGDADDAPKKRQLQRHCYDNINSTK